MNKVMIKKARITIIGGGKGFTIPKPVMNSGLLNISEKCNYSIFVNGTKVQITNAKITPTGSSHGLIIPISILTGVLDLKKRYDFEIESHLKKHETDGNNRQG